MCLFWWGAPNIYLLRVKLPQAVGELVCQFKLNHQLFYLFIYTFNGHCFPRLVNDLKVSMNDFCIVVFLNSPRQNLMSSWRQLVKRFGFVGVGCGVWVVGGGRGRVYTSCLNGEQYTAISWKEGAESVETFSCLVQAGFL